MMITYVLPELVIALQLYHPQGFRQRYPILLPPFPLLDPYRMTIGGLLRIVKIFKIPVKWMDSEQSKRGSWRIEYRFLRNKDKAQFWKIKYQKVKT